MTGPTMHGVYRHRTCRGTVGISRRHPHPAPHFPECYLVTTASIKKTLTWDRPDIQGDPKCSLQVPLAGKSSGLSLSCYPGRQQSITRWDQKRCLMASSFYWVHRRYTLCRMEIDNVRTIASTCVIRMLPAIVGVEPLPVRSYEDGNIWKMPTSRPTTLISSGITLRMPVGVDTVKPPVCQGISDFDDTGCKKRLHAENRCMAAHADPKDHADR